MKYEDVYNLSKKYSPPKVNLRDAMIMDSYGDETYAKRSIQHSKPEDVTREDFDYYGWVYPFMKFEDLLYYLYPIAAEFEKDQTLDCIDGFMYSLDRALPSKKHLLEVADAAALNAALRWIWELGGDNAADWRQCPNLQDEIGVSVE